MRCHQVGVRDLVVVDQCGQLVPRRCTAGRRQHQRGPAGQRSSRCPPCDTSKLIDTASRNRAASPSPSPSTCALTTLDTPWCVTTTPFGVAGRPRGVDHVRGVADRQRTRPVRVGRVGRRCLGQGLGGGRCVDGEHRAGRRQPVRDRLDGEHHGRPGVAEHEPDPLGRVARVDRQVRGAGLQHGQPGRDQLGRPRKRQRHKRLGPDTAARSGGGRAGWPRRSARRSSARCRRRRPPPRPGSAEPVPAPGSGRVTGGTAGPVSFQSCSTSRRSSPDSTSRPPCGAEGSAATASNRLTSRAATRSASSAV